MAASRSRYPAISLQSAEGAVPKNDSKSVAYEIRTKSAKCGGLETNGPRERISGPSRCGAVRRFSREARGYWRFQHAKIWRRMLVADGSAEGEVLPANPLQFRAGDALLPAHDDVKRTDRFSVAPFAPAATAEAHPCGWQFSRASLAACRN